MRYTIEKEPKEGPVLVKLIKRRDRIALIVGKWEVFQLCADGTGHLCKRIPEDNEEGLQADSEGCIILE